jgi:hypothetical protein
VDEGRTTIPRCHLPSSIALPCAKQSGVWRNDRAALGQAAATSITARAAELTAATAAVSMLLPVSDQVPGLLALPCQD